MTLRYLKNDFKHYLVNIAGTLLALIFYAKFGFYGWHHLISLIGIQFAALALDDWIDNGRPFPYYTLPMLVFAGYFYPVVMILSLVGVLVVNLRALMKNNAFMLERIEGLGNIPIAVMPLTLPIGLNNGTLYLAASLFLLFADSFHKIAHNDTKYPQAMWATGLLALALLLVIFATPTWLFFTLTFVTLLSLIPFWKITDTKWLYRYSQAWFGFAGAIAFYYYLTFFA